MLKLFSFYAEYGRQGDLEGLFISTQEEVDRAIGKYMHFGEVLGKHSNVEGTLEAEEITVISDNQEKVEWLVKIIGYDVSGFNPLNYISEDQYDDEDDDFDDEEDFE